MTTERRERSILPTPAVYMNQVKERSTKYFWAATQGAEHGRKLRRRPNSCSVRTLRNPPSIRMKKTKSPRYTSSIVAGNRTRHCGWKWAKNSLAVISSKLHHWNPLRGMNDKENLVYHTSLNANPKLTRRYYHKKAVPRRKTPRILSVLDAPGAPLNTTSDIINSKLNDRLRDQSTPSYGFRYMEELLGLHRTSSVTGEFDKLIGCQSEMKQPNGDQQTIIHEELGDCGLVFHPSEQYGMRSSSLAERHIGGLNDDSVVLKERMACMEQELLGLKLRLSLLEEGKTGCPEREDSCDASFGP